MKIFKTLWQLPQVLLAYLVILFSKSKYKEDYSGIKIYETEKRFGISLGTMIILYSYYNEKTLKHEYGHTRQSLMLGPLYLIIVGLPSITMNIISRFNKKFAANYYNRWPENWADELGKVER